MRRLMTWLVLGSMWAPVPVLVGCDETKEQQKSVEVKSDGTKVTQEKKVTESPDGTITKTEEKKVDRP